MVAYPATLLPKRSLGLCQDQANASMSLGEDSGVNPGGGGGGGYNEFLNGQKRAKIMKSKS